MDQLTNSWKAGGQQAASTGTNFNDLAAMSKFPRPWEMNPIWVGILGFSFWRMNAEYRTCTSPPGPSNDVWAPFESNPLKCLTYVPWYLFPDRLRALGTVRAAGLILSLGHGDGEVKHGRTPLEGILVIRHR